MMRRAWLVVWLCLFSVVGCGSCHSCGEKPLAELVAMHGQVGVSRARAPAEFDGASVGTDFSLGDAARTGRDSTAKLQLDDGNHLEMRPQTTIRFSATRPGARGRRIELLEGEATLTITEDTWLDTGNGTLRANGGTQLRLRRDAGNLQLVVLVGQARLEAEGDPPMDIQVGTAVMLELATAVASRADTNDAEPTKPADSVEGAARIAVDAALSLEDQIEVGPNLLANRVDFTLVAGEGIVLRDPNPPTAIGVQTAPACPGHAVVQVFDGSRLVGSARGTGTVPVTFGEGAFTYRVRCVSDGQVSEPSAQGRVRVVRATGQAPLPRSAPVSNVEADGRTYQILYSNRLPSVSIRWPHGPSGAGTLVIGGGRRIAVSGPRHRFASGSLSEGTHRVHFESGGRRSRDTDIVIRFDPVAAAASLDSPADGSFAPGERVRVSGMALPGNTVIAAGQNIPVGPDQRFSGEVVAPTSGALVIRLVRGDHASIFIRRPHEATQ